MSGLHSASRNEAERFAAPGAPEGHVDGLGRASPYPDERSLRELAVRQDDGIEVVLFWDSVADHVVLGVRDSRAEESFVCIVDGADALDAFRHPFAYIRRPAALGGPSRQRSPRAERSG